MNQFLSNKIISGIVAVALLVGVGVLISSGDTSSTTRNVALVVATSCTKPGQVTKVSKQAVVCAKTNTGSLWYATMKAKGKAQPCTKPGAIRKKSNIVWVCGVIKKKKLWQATQPLPPAVVASTTVIEPGATQPTPALDSTQVATPETPVVADNTVLADTKIPDDKIVTQVIDTPSDTPVESATTTTPTTTPATVNTAPAPATTTTTRPANITTPPTTPATTTTTTPATTTRFLSWICATGGTCQKGDTGPGGGIVFYVAATTFTSTGSGCDTACKYLEVSPAAAQAQATWGCKGTITGATGTAIGTGKSNTARILANSCAATGIAADIANKYSTTNTAGQWYLASKDELSELCKTYSNGRTDTTAYSQWQNGCTGSLNPSVGLATGGSYWSSTEGSTLPAWYQNFYYGVQGNYSKDLSHHVRPVRAFAPATSTTTTTSPKFRDAAGPATTTIPATTTTTIPATCARGGTCKVRDIGPGGGIVFYVTTTPFKCGQYLTATCTYLEAAIANATTPSTWTPNTKAQWGCYQTLVSGTSLEIGTGLANTKIITNKFCIGTDSSTSAASIAGAYNGGNKTDWFLPSRKELDALCNEFFKERTGQNYSLDNCMGSGNTNAVTGTSGVTPWSFAASYYWSSSETYVTAALAQSFANGLSGGGPKYTTYYVRPVRAF